MFFFLCMDYVGGVNMLLRTANKYEMTAVDLNNVDYKDEPFVLAADMSLVFYMKDMSSKPKRWKNNDNLKVNHELKPHIILHGKRNIVGIEDKSNMLNDYERYDQIPPFKVNKDPNIL